MPSPSRAVLDQAVRADAPATSAAQAPSKPPRPETFSARLLDGLDDPRLAAASDETRNVFQSKAFLAAIGRHIVDEGSRLVLVEATDSAGQLVAVFPFVKRRRLGIPVIEGLDFGVTDFFAPTCLRDAPLSAEETRRLWQAVIGAVPGVHAVTFMKMPRLLHGRLHALSGADFVLPMHATATTLFMRDEQGAPTVRPDKMSLAREVRRKSKKLEQIGPLSFAEATSKAETDAAMETLVAFRTARFSELGRDDALLDPDVVAFYRSLADRDQEDPPGRLFVLRAGDEVAAVIYGFVFGDAFTLIAPAITPSRLLQVGSPGLVILFKALEWSVARNFRVFDLSVGSLSYKSRFEAETVELFEYQRSLSPLGLPVVAEFRLRRWLRRLALSHPQLRTTLERLAGMLKGSRNPGS